MSKYDNLHAGNCIRTFTGLYIDVFNPTPDMICIEDIAHGLSNVCRFAGQIPEFYSVAQHSVVVHNYVNKEHRLQALLHDASEAYLGDMPSPIKRKFSEYKKVEENLMKVIAEKFGFDHELHPSVKEADKKVLEQEWEYFVKGSKEDPIWIWEIPEQHFISTFNQIKRDSIANKNIKMSFKDAPIGARFKFIDPELSKNTYVKINSHDDGLIVRWNGNVKGHQSHCCWIDKENGYNFDTLIELI